MKLRNKKTGEIRDACFYIQGGYSYKTMREYYEEWEDYKPAEPLIKDKEVRTMIKLWAKYHNANTFRYLGLDGIDGHYLKAGINTLDIDIENLSVGCYYTLEELCGEEEE